MKMKPAKTASELIDIVKQAIAKAESKDTTLPARLFEIRGMSSRKGRILLNELCKSASTYLEVGLNQGSTFCSAVHGQGKKLTAIGIDNWSQFGGPKGIFAENLHSTLTRANTVIIEADCFAPRTVEQVKALSPIDLFFYDGAHDWDSQVKATKLFLDIMPEAGILVVDDWTKWGRTPTLRTINQTKGVKIADYKVLTDGWWEGVGVLVLTRQD